MNTFYALLDVLPFGLGSYGVAGIVITACLLGATVCLLLAVHYGVRYQRTPLGLPVVLAHDISTVTRAEHDAFFSSFR